jgi:hypothetical protein
MFKNILKQSWQIIWRNPILWIFGLFSALIGGNELTLIINHIDRLSYNLYSLSRSYAWQLFPQFNNILKGQINWLMIFFLILGLIILFLLAIFSQIGLIVGVKHYQQKQKINFKSLIKDSRPYFRSVLLINLASLILIYLVFALISYPFASWFLSSNHAGWLAVYFLLNLIIFLPLVLIIYLIVHFAIIDLVFNSNKINISLVKAGLFLKKNWLKTFILILILGVIGLAFGLILVALGAFTSTLLTSIATGLYQIKINLPFSVFVVLLWTIVFLFFILLEGIFYAFQNFVWTLFYLARRPTSPPGH